MIRLLIIQLLFSGYLFSQDTIDFSEKTWGGILKQAQEEDKLIYLDCYTAWCSPCKKMDQTVFTNDEVIDFYENNFINCKIDMEKGVGPELVEKYNIKVYPTHLFIDGNGLVIHRSASFKNTKEFLKLGYHAITSTKQTSLLEEMYLGGNKTPEFLIDYVQYLVETYQDHCYAFDDYLRAISQGDLFVEKNIRFIYDYTDNITSYAYQIFENIMPQLKSYFTLDQIEFKYFLLCTNSVKIAAKEMNEALLDASVELYREKIKSKNKELAISQTLYMEFYRKTKDYTKLNKEIWSYIDRFITPKENILLQDNSKVLKEIRKGEKTKSWSYYDSKPKTVVSKFNEHAKDLFSFARIVFYEKTGDDTLKKNAISWLKFAISIEEKIEYYDLLLRFYKEMNKLHLASPYLERTFKLAKKEKHFDEDYKELKRIIDSL